MNGLHKTKRRGESVLFDEVYIVGVVMLTWFLFRLSLIVFVTLFWNVCVPSALLSFNLDHFGLFWFVVATDVFVLAWLAIYLVRSVRRREGALGRSIFAVTMLVFVAGNLVLLPVLLEWRVVERHPSAAYDLLWASEHEDWSFDFPPPGRIAAERWEPCVLPGLVRFGIDVLRERGRQRFAFWTFYDNRRSSDMKTALYLAHERIQKNHADGRAWAMRALVYGNAVDYGIAPAYEATPSARNSLRRALTYAPQLNETRAAYGLLMRNRDTEGAEDKLRQCIASEPEYAECHNLLGDLLRKTGRAEQAGEVYLEGLERWPNNGELHVSYALYLQETGRAPEAIDYLRQFVAEQPSFPRGHWHLAVMLYEKGGDLDEAREHAVKALEMDPKIWNGEKLLLELDRLR